LNGVMREYPLPARNVLIDRAECNPTWPQKRVEEQSERNRRDAEARAFLLESSDEGIARIASRVGYETAAAFSKLFHRHHGLSPGRYRATRHSDHGRK
jgi:AraC-like DNA-binding protein